MGRIMNRSLALATLVLLAGCTASPQPGTVEQPTGAPTSPSGTSVAPGVTSSVDVGPPPSDPVAAAAWQTLMGPDGEYAAAATYDAVIDRYGPVEPYVSIKAAEERHAAALTRQLERLGVQVPANPYLGRVAAPASLKEAANAWAQGEVDNVALYDRLAPSVASDPRLTRVFANLRRASQDVHLPTFRAAAAGDGTLSADAMGRLSSHR